MTSILDRINALPADTWRRCPGCSGLVHRDGLARHAHTCPDCGHHFPLRAAERIAMLADPGSFTERHGDLAPLDPLSFTDRLPYPDRLARARRSTGLQDAVVTGTATLGGRPVVLAVLDFAFLGGSMGSVVGEKVALAAELALRTRAPLVAVSASGGARMQEGVLSLLQMAKTAAAVRRLRDAGVPYLSVLADPVYGGVAASFASLGDVIVAEEGARAGFAGPRVIEQTIRQELPPGFQTARFLHEHGHVDIVVRRQELRGTLSRLVSLLTLTADRPTLPPRPSPGPGRAAADPGRSSSAGSGRSSEEEAVPDAWESVRLARAPERPNATRRIEELFTGFTELHGDRQSGDDPAVIGGPARLGGVAVMVVAHRKGAGTAENVARNFGMPHPAGYRKAMRLYGLAERHRLPVVTLVDTPGAYPGIAAEEGNQSGAIAESLALAAGLRTPVLSVITGEGGSGGALALAVADRLLIEEHGVFSVISPEGAASILFGDASRAPDLARALRLRATDLRELGLVDAVVPERPGALARALVEHLGGLLAVPVEELVERRYRRLRSYGTWTTEKEDRHG
ncbi:Acetyl-coenzyme A carboxyl transferase alpha chain [[Actinomadura] parvosata subsp. kistnae]|uniref:Multifunctional fusion protein n=1 Tax=[Actinomadura] parvosata subsp. kistnae TaxID=1909395 RepID=A0A1V0AC74_9ACTN|nr:acetyl-CoA carboxylase, carboxyltransferase subunit beta [Nonomuraea sp. ATCC 55076]AQZ67821.1 acetyl-CoA carboxylase subunit beta [Nonomuraea sp. ATCC 55076]SPL93860.1 Acetyl-coenzyme A carboxyl transferase alpha chain [Actinomadura parvosata subsp. kistnae]